ISDQVLQARLGAPVVAIDQPLAAPAVVDQSLAAAAIQTSLRLNGLTSYVDVPAAPDLNLTGNWTVEAWFKDEDPNGFNHENRSILSKGDPALGSEVPYFVQEGHNNIIAGLRTGGRTAVI